MRRLGLAQGAIALLGSLLLVVLALPLASDGSGMAAVDWTPLLVSGAGVGLVGGALEGGLCLLKKSALAVVVAVPAGVVGLGVPAFWAAPPGGVLRTDSVDLFAALAGWVMYIAVSLVVAACVVLLGVRRGARSVA